MKTIRIVLIAVVLACIFSTAAVAAEQAKNPICMYYFTGIGCPHCANVDPFMLGEWLDEYPDLIVVEYEIYKHRDNVPIFQSFVTQFNISPGVPNVLMGINGSVAGDTPILGTVPGILQNRANITAHFGNVFYTLDRCEFASLSGSPQIWNDDRILIRTGPESGDDAFLKELLLNDDLSSVVAGQTYEEIDPVPVNISGGSLEFEHAIRTGDWILQWNGTELQPEETPTPEAPVPVHIGIVALVAAAAVLVAQRR